MKTKTPRIGRTLLASDLAPNLLIICTDHPEWGTWRVLRKYDDGIWEIRGERGDRVLMEDEAHFWSLAA